MKQFQQDYDDLMNRVKKQITQSIKPSSLLPKTGGIGGKSTTTKDQGGDEESKDTSVSGSGSTSNRMSLVGGLKRPGAQSVQPKATTSRRSDSKESTNKTGTDSNHGSRP